VEITNQIAGLEEDIKLLKGEIKAILKEIRAAVLSNDNPFVAKPAQTGSAGPASPADDEPALSASAPQPVQPLPAPTASPSHDIPETQPRETEHAAERSWGNEPVSIHSKRPAQEQPESQVTLFTIASLLAWTDDAIAALGVRRFRLMLELAYFAELLSPDVRDVLRDLAGLWPDSDEPDRPVSVNECLLQLRQLEAVVNGERVTRLPRQRRRRRAR
jgi:hypothetical protein